MKYSIITVNYNNKDGLRKTIESVISQTFKDFEYIVIDGGSTDGSTDILHEYDNQINYWISEKDTGIYNAMNKGIAYSKGEYLNFMNSGDSFYDPNVLQKVFNYGYNTDFIIGKDYHYDDKTQMGHASIQPERITMITFFNGSLDHQSSFIKRNLFNKSMYREDYRLVSDWIFYIEKIVKEGNSVSFIPDIVCMREEGGLSFKLQDKNRYEISNYIHSFLPVGVISDYETIAKLDRTSIYRLFRICDNEKFRKILILFLKLVDRISFIFKLS